MTTDFDLFRENMNNIALKLVNDKDFYKRYLSYHNQKLAEMKKAMHELRWIQHIWPYLYNNSNLLVEKRRSFLELRSYNLLKINRSADDGKKAFNVMIKYNYSPPKNIDDLILHGTVVFEYNNATIHLPINSMDFKIDLCVFRLTIAMREIIAQQKYKIELNPREKVRPMILKKIREKKPKKNLVHKLYSEHKENFVNMAFDPMCDKIREIFENRHNEGFIGYKSLRPPSKSTIKRYLRSIQQKRFKKNT